MEFVTAPNVAALLELLNDGYKIATVLPHRHGGVCAYYNIVSDGEIIHYSHYGSSAVKATPDKLQWLLDVIFEIDVADVTTKYALLSPNQQLYV